MSSSSSSSMPIPLQLIICVDNSAADARKCSQLLMESTGRKIKAAHDGGESSKDIKMPQLLWKNTYRLARALHFGNAEDSEVHYPLHLIEQQSEESGEYGSMATKMRKQLDYYLRMPSNNKEFEPPLLRASFQNPYVEYYNFGTFALFIVSQRCNKYCSLTIINLPPPPFLYRPR